MSFENKLAIVTGSYQGLGKGIAKKLASQGCNLILVDIDDNLYQTKDELLQYGTKVEFYIGDVSDEDLRQYSIPLIILLMLIILIVFIIVIYVRKRDSYTDNPIDSSDIL